MVTILYEFFFITDQCPQKKLAGLPSFYKNGSNGQLFLNLFSFGFEKFHILFLLIEREQKNFLFSSVEFQKNPYIQVRVRRNETVVLVFGHHHQTG